MDWLASEDRIPKCAQSGEGLSSARSREDALNDIVAVRIGMYPRVRRRGYLGCGSHCRTLGEKHSIMVGIYVHTEPLEMGPSLLPQRIR